MDRFKKFKKIGDNLIRIIFALHLGAFIFLFGPRLFKKDLSISSETILIFTAIALGLFCVGIYRQRRFSDDYSKDAFNQFMSELLNNPIIEADSEKIDTVMQAGFFKKPKKREIMGYLKDTYKGLDIEVCNFLLFDDFASSSNGNNSAKAYKFFKGQILIIDYKKDINLTIKCFENLRYSPKITDIFSVRTNSAKFDNTFETFASSFDGATTFLTTKLQEYLLSLFSKHSCLPYFGFIKGKMYLAINQVASDISTHKMRKPIDKDYLEKVDGIINLVKLIIDEVNNIVNEYSENKSN